MRHEIPFFKNSPDSTRCFLACMKMVLAHVEPGKEYTWEQLDEITGKRHMLGAWHFGGLAYIAAIARRKGKRMVVIERFPYRWFHIFPVCTTLAFFGLRAGMWQVLLSHLRTEARMVSAFLRAFPVGTSATQTIWREERVPTLHDLIALLDAGYVAIVQVNGYMIDGEGGYGGHAILVVGYTDTTMITHNPRLPGSAYKHVSRALFERSWHSPYARCANIYAIEV